MRAKPPSSQLRRSRSAADYGSEPVSCLGTVGNPMSAVGDERLEILLERGRQEKCLELSEVSELIAALGLDDRGVAEVFERIESCGVKIQDDCGRDLPEQVQYGNEELASATTDALGLFKELGLSEHLTPQRSNGVRSMVERIRRDAHMALAAS